MPLTKATYSMIDGASVNVKDFGAVGDGVADDTSAIQLAINAAIPTGKQIVFPHGTYKTTSQLNVSLSSSSHGLFMRGEGKAIINSTATGSVLDVTSADPNTRGYFVTCLIDGMQFFGDGINNDHVLSIYGTAYWLSSIQNSIISGAKVSLIEINDCWEFSLDNVQIGWGAASRTTANTVGVDVLNANAFNMTNCDVSTIGLNYTGIGVRCQSATAAYINNNTIENIQVGVEILNGEGSVTISQNYFENQPVVQALLSKTVPFLKIGSNSDIPMVSVRDNWFSINNDQYLIEFANVSHGEIANNVNNPDFVNPSYFNIETNSSNIEVCNNDNLLPPADGKAGLTTTDLSRTINAKFSSDHPTLWIPANTFQISSGAPTQVTGTYGPAWQFQDTSTNAIEAGVIIPPSWGICSVRVWSMVSLSSTTSDAITWFGAATILKSDGTTIAPAVGSANFTWDGRPANTPRVITNSTLWDVTRTDYLEPLTIVAQRSGGGAGDTFTGNAVFYGAVIERISVGDTF